MSESIYRDLGGGRSIFYGWGEAMHTRIDAILCHRPEEACEEALRQIVGELKRLDSRLNRFDPSSDIARINVRAADRPVAVDGEMWDILASVLRCGAKTDFHFDVTYASKKGSPQTRLHLDPGKREILFKTRGTVIDLGGYGKGYGLGKAQEMLLAGGWTDFLLNFGNSTVCARGDRPGGEGWNIGVENQCRPGSNALEIILRNQSLNTSGNTGRHTRHIWSAKYSEYIPGLKSVSVVTDGPLEGEILSTALFGALHDDGNGALPPFLGAFPDVRVFETDYRSGTSVVKIRR